MKFVTFLICILIQHIVNVTSFENHLNDLNSPMKKNYASFETLRIEKINEYKRANEKIEAGKTQKDLLIFSTNTAFIN